MPLTRMFPDNLRCFQIIFVIQNRSRPLLPQFGPSTVRVSDEFYRELIEHPVPVDLDALRLLQSSPLRLDIYAWLTQRNSYAKRRSNITWTQLRNQFGSNTRSDTRQGRAKFRELFTRQLGYVLAVYPSARVDVQPEGIVAHPAPPHVQWRPLP